MSIIRLPVWLLSGKMYSFPCSKKPRAGTHCVPARGFALIQNATFMNSATQHKITASGT